MSYNPPTIPGQSYVAGTLNTRRVTMAMGGDGSTGAVTPTNSDICARWGFTLAVTPTRFRLRIRNSNLLANTNVSGAITLAGCYIGTPNTANEPAGWAGDFTGAPTTLGISGTIDPGATGAEFVSSWISPSTFQIAANTFLGLSMGITCSGVQLNTSPCPGWAWEGTGSAAAAANAAAPGTTAQPYQTYMDVRLEYEFVGVNQIGLYVADSIGAGQLGAQVNTGHMGPDSTWPGMAGLRLGHGVSNGGVSGGTAPLFGNGAVASLLCWARFLSPESGQTTLACVPDYMAIALGVNDSSDPGSDPLAGYQLWMDAIMAKGRAFGIPRAYVCTATTGYQITGLGLFGWSAGQLQTALAGASTSVKVGTVGISTAALQPGGPGHYGGQPGVAGLWYTGSGTWRFYIGTPEAGGALGPFTATNATGAGEPGTVVTITIGSTSITAAVGAPVLTASEYFRREINQWLRTCPPGAQSVIDFDADTTSQFYWPNATGRHEFYANSGNVHPIGPAMYLLMATRFVNGIVGN